MDKKDGSMKGDWLICGDSTPAPLGDVNDSGSDVMDGDPSTEWINPRWLPDSFLGI